MRVLGIDFTSSPRRHKPIVCLNCDLIDRVLRTGELESWPKSDVSGCEPDFSGFEQALQRSGPWIAGIDFPFGQSRRFIEGIRWPQDWREYVRHARSLGRDGFCKALDDYRRSQPMGDRYHRRKTDVSAGSISPQTLHYTPVGLMFFEGAPRLVKAGVTIPHLQTGDPERIVVEAYPGVVARTIIGRTSYKSDTRRRQTPQLRAARDLLLAGLRNRAPKLYGIKIDASDKFCGELCEDPTGDSLDALLCAIQAAWAWQQRTNGYGAPSSLDTLEGWIAIPKRDASELLVG
jgi:Protein of unknown function (DUF429)